MNLFHPWLVIVLIGLALRLDPDRRREEYERSEGIRNGDQRLFRDFYNETYPRVYRFLISRGTDHEDATDILQNVYIYLWEVRSRINPDKSLTAYLFQTVYSRMLNHVKYRSKFADAEQAEQALDALTGAGSPEKTELHTVLESIMKRMPDKRAQVFEYCFMQQFSYRETAEIMGISAKTVENHMSAALREIRSGLTSIYGEDLWSE